MVQAVACRAAIYGFNSHPQLHFAPKFLLRVLFPKGFFPYATVSWLFKGYLLIKWD
jgi:hypothetical protein